MRVERQREMKMSKNTSNAEIIQESISDGFLVVGLMAQPLGLARGVGA
jgi:hypothetical protein